VRRRAPGQEAFTSQDAVTAARTVAVLLAAACGLLVGLVPLLVDATLCGSFCLRRGALVVGGTIGISVLAAWLAAMVVAGLGERAAASARLAALLATVRLPPAAQHALRLGLPARLPRLAAATARGAAAVPLVAGASAAAGGALRGLALVGPALLAVGAGLLLVAVVVAILTSTPAASTLAAADRQAAEAVAAALSPLPAAPADPRVALAAGPALERRLRAGLTAAVGQAGPLPTIGLPAAAAVGTALFLLGPAISAADALLVLGELAVLGGAAFAVSRAASAHREAVAARADLTELTGSDQLPREVALVVPGRRRLAGAVSFRRVTVGFGLTRPLLAGLDFDIAPGERAGVLLPPGPAASVVAALVAGLLEPEDGAVLLDGMDTRILAPQLVWSHVALVPQEPALLPGTLLDNLAAGAGRHPDLARVRFAAELTGLDQLAGRLHGGLDTSVAEHWWQPDELRRLALARALVANPAVVVLHDPTAGLDPAAERLIQTAVDELATDRTCILLADRPAALTTAELVIVAGRERPLARHPAPDLELPAPPAPGAYPSARP
jgi:ABC-type multidrug transport system fused ATPase/permease subunit